MLAPPIYILVQSAPVVLQPEEDNPLETGGCGECVTASSKAVEVTLLTSERKMEHEVDRCISVASAGIRTFTTETLQTADEVG